MVSYSYVTAAACTLLGSDLLIFDLQLFYEFVDEITIELESN